MGLPGEGLQPLAGGALLAVDHNDKFRVLWRRPLLRADAHPKGDEEVKIVPLITAPRFLVLEVANW